MRLQHPKEEVDERRLTDASSCDTKCRVEPWQKLLLVGLASKYLLANRHVSSHDIECGAMVSGQRKEI